MSALKRIPSARATRLTARGSPYSSLVTLYEASGSTDAIEESPRRSKRVKLSITPEKVSDMEDLVQNVSRPRALGGVDATATTAASPSTKSPRKSKPIQTSLEIPHPAPHRWQETYGLIKEMRTKIVAPVDTMGCDQAQLQEHEPKNRRWATLVSLMLSSQTKDEVTDAAVSKLRAALGGSLSVNGILAADDTTISEAIGKVGFWRRKTQYIKQTAQRLRDDFDSDVPKTVDDLCSLPGVGPKMAFLALQIAWNLNVGIGVDVHVHRITNRLGWHKLPTKNPEQTRLNLQSWLPSELHPEINHMLVGFGQMICLPVKPRCEACTLASQGLCPSSQISKSKKVTVVFSNSEPGIAINNEGQNAQGGVLPGAIHEGI